MFLRGDDMYEHVYNGYDEYNSYDGYDRYDGYDQEKRSKRAGSVRYDRSRISAIIVGILLIAIGVAILFFGQNSKTPEVEASTIMQKYYTSIEIKDGDSLWTLAEEYGKRYADPREFITEVRSINQLKGDHITAGANLMIPVYR